MMLYRYGLGWSVEMRVVGMICSSHDAATLRAAAGFERSVGNSFPDVARTAWGTWRGCQCLSSNN